MVMFQVGFSCCIVLLLSNFCVGDLNTLRLVNILYRHGDRGPVLVFPNDPNQASSWHQGLGYLTELGIRQHYELGKYFRQRYDGYLNQTYDVSEVYLNSSNVDRCLMSAYSNLAGLYPPEGYQVWNDQIPWQPIPVHTTPEASDNMLALGADCPKYTQLYAKSLKSPEVLHEEETNKEFYEFVAQESGVKKETIENIWQIVDALYCEKVHNKTWAPWVNDTIFQKLRELENWGFDLLFKGPVESRLKGGPILKRFIENMQLKVQGKLTQKAMIYIGHDTTIAALMNALQVFNMISPPYTATFIMELHEENQQYYIQTYYKNDTYPNPVTVYDIVIPGCDKKCPLNKFISLTEDRVPIDWHAECQIPDTSLTSSTLATNSPDNSTNKMNAVPALVIGVLAGMILLLSLIIVIFQLWQKRQNRIRYSLLSQKGEVPPS